MFHNFFKKYYTFHIYYINEYFIFTIEAVKKSYPDTNEGKVGEVLGQYLRNIKRK